MFYLWREGCIRLSLHTSVCLCSRVRFVLLTVTWCALVCICMRWAYAVSPWGCCRCRVVCVFVCACEYLRMQYIVSACKLERHVAGWNPIRVHCQHAAVLTWYACYSNFAVKNRLSPGYFSARICSFKASLIFLSRSLMPSSNYSYCLPFCSAPQERELMPEELDGKRFLVQLWCKHVTNDSPTAQVHQLHWYFLLLRSLLFLIHERHWRLHRLPWKSFSMAEL